MPSYTKPALAAADLVVLLRSRGLIIRDRARAERYINNIGYYRLSAYCKPFYRLGEPNVFMVRKEFNDVLRLYIFDRKLRLLALDPVQRIEVAVRTAISNHMSLTYGPFWFLDSKLFADEKKHTDMLTLSLKQAGRGYTRSHSCTQYFNVYGDNLLPPSWILFEELSMGCWSKLFANIKNNQDKRAIAASFNFDWHHFASWLQSITIIRNIIAHHKRFWNVDTKIKPKGITRYAVNCGKIKGPYQNFVIIMYMLKTFVHHTSWATELSSHLADCPLDVHTHMKFPLDWQTLPFWS